MSGRAPVLLGSALDTSLLTLVVCCMQRCVPGIRHSAIYVIPGFRQVRISVIVRSSRKLGTRNFRNRPVPEIRYAPLIGDARPATGEEKDGPVKTGLTVRQSWKSWNCSIANQLNWNPPHLWLQKKLLESMNTNWKCPIKCLKSVNVKYINQKSKMLYLCLMQVIKLDCNAIRLRAGV